MDEKLASDSESLDTKLNVVSDSLNPKINSMILNVISEMRKENDRMRQGFSTWLNNEVQTIAKEWRWLGKILLWN